MARLSQQASDQFQSVETALVTPAAQKGMADANRSAVSSSTLPERQSAQGSSTWVTPRSNDKEVSVNGRLGISAPTSGLDQMQKRDEGSRSLSPTEIRKHHLSRYQPGPSKAHLQGTDAIDSEGTPSRAYHTSRVSLFGSPVRPEAALRNGASIAEFDVHHANSSALNLRQHERENHLPSVTALSRIGAR
jgi:hypothetical protein